MELAKKFPYEDDGSEFQPSRESSALKKAKEHLKSVANHLKKTPPSKIQNSFFWNLERDLLEYFNQAEENNWPSKVQKKIESALDHTSSICSWINKASNQNTITPTKYFNLIRQLKRILKYFQ